jgi:cell division protein FtsW
MSGILNKIKGDKAIWGIVMSLAVISLLIIFSSTGQLAYKYQDGNTFYYFVKHLIILGLGFAIIYAVHKVKYSYFSRVSQLLIYISIPLLLITLFMGDNINSANRWLHLPIVNISFQTSDLAKLALISYLARVLSKKQHKLNSFKDGFLPVAVPVILVCGLILKADFSTSFMILGIAILIMVVGRVPWKFIFGLIGAGVLALVIFVSVALAFFPGETRVETWKSRLISKYSGEADPDKNYQANLSKAAIANGGVLGTFFHGENKYALPHPYSDFVYATIVEDLGMIGGLLVLFLYLFLLYRAIKIAMKCDNLFGMLLVIGCGLMLVVQALSNIAVAVGIFPVTGQPLPLVSMGGTSIWFSSIAIGMILSVSNTIEKKEPKPKTSTDVG